MSPRPFARMPRAAVSLLVAAGLLAMAGGCDPRALVYFLQPFEPTIKPLGPSLKGKKVVILTHASASAWAEYQGKDREIADGLAKKLKAKVRRIEVVPQEKVRLWAEAHPSYTDPADAGRAFDADMVIFLELVNYQIQSPLSPDMFSGRSVIHVQVHELLTPTDENNKPIQGQPKASTVIYNDTVETSFPRVQESLPLSSTVNRSTFDKKFFELVVSELSWQFVEHASGDDIQDTNF